MLALPGEYPCRCFQNAEWGTSYRDIDWKDIDFIPGYCWLLADPEPRQRLTRRVEGGRGNARARLPACLLLPASHPAPCRQPAQMCPPVCLPALKGIAGTRGLICFDHALLCWGADNRPGTPWASGIVL